MNPHFLNYPSFYLYIQFLVQGILYPGMKLVCAVDSTTDYQVLSIVQRTLFFLSGRLINTFFGSATSLVTYLLGRRITEPVMAEPAALLIAIKAVHISKSQMVGADVPMTFFAVLILLFALRLLEAPSKRKYLTAGKAFGLAICAAASILRHRNGYKGEHRFDGPDNFLFRSSREFEY